MTLTGFSLVVSGEGFEERVLELIYQKFEFQRLRNFASDKSTVGLLLQRYFSELSWIEEYRLLTIVTYKNTKRMHCYLRY